MYGVRWPTYGATITPVQHLYAYIYKVGKIIFLKGGGAA